MVTEKELEKGLIYRGKNPHCTYCGKRLRQFVLKVKGGTEWDIKCGKCGRRPPEPKKAFLDNISGKQAIIGFLIIFAICILIGT